MKTQDESIAMSVSRREKIVVSADGRRRGGAGTRVVGSESFSASTRVFRHDDSGDTADTRVDRMKGESDEAFEGRCLAAARAAVLAVVRVSSPGVDDSAEEPPTAP